MRNLPENPKGTIEAGLVGGRLGRTACSKLRQTDVLQASAEALRMGGTVAIVSRPKEGEVVISLSYGQK